jgi:hypothetical protein
MGVPAAFVDGIRLGRQINTGERDSPGATRINGEWAIGCV